MQRWEAKDAVSSAIVLVLIHNGAQVEFTYVAISLHRDLLIVELFNNMI